MGHSSFFYSHFGGCLFPDSPVYVEREADTELYETLLKGKYCYVINARQMGKSSLRVRTSAKLQNQGMVCVELDLSGIGDQDLTIEQWYSALIQELASGLGLQRERRNWIKENPQIPSPYSLSHFIESVVLTAIDRPIILFIDEIDCILRLKFSSDSFLSSIRYWHERRSTNPSYRNLTVALFGASAPAELIQGQNAIPFNFGRSIDLTGLKLEKSLVLAEGLEHIADKPVYVLREVIDWTNGQPFLTQKLCWLIASFSTYISAGNEPEKVKEIVHSHIFTNWESNDDPAHLRTIRDRITKHPQLHDKLLNLYRKIVEKGKARNDHSPLSIELQLSGMVYQQNKYLFVKNKIYQNIFDLEWVRCSLESNNRKENQLSRLTNLSITAATAVAVICVRWLGALEGIELLAYDLVLRQMPLEEADERLYIVEIDQRDLNKFGDPIPDSVLARLLDVLVKNNAQAIGLDLFRDFSEIDKEQDTSLSHHYLHTEELIAVCKKQSLGMEDIPPPSWLGKRTDQWSKVGFANLYVDTSFFSQGDYREPVRRYVLSMTPNDDEELSISDYPACVTPYSFGIQIAIRYLYSQGITTRTRDNDWVFGNVLARRLQPNSGGYHNLDSRGNQLLLRYRRLHNPQEITPYRTSLRELLLDKNTAWIKDKIVLIGIADSDSDIHTTPVGEMHGVHTHAHLVSQLISAVYDQRRFPWWLPWWGEIFWIVGWSVVAGVTLLLIRRSLLRGLAILLVSIVLYICCWASMTQGGWLPLVPPALSIGTIAVLMVSWQVAGRRFR